MNKSESIKELAGALAKAQADLKNPHFDSTNPHFKSKFASLACVRDTITPVLAKYGLSVTQLPSNDEQGRPCVESVLMHSSGEWISTTLTVPAGKADAHGAGSAITYARRYALMALVNVVGDEDDDGNGAVERPQVAQQPRMPDGLLESAQEAALEGTEAFRAFWKKANPSIRDMLKAHLPRLQAAAQSADSAEVV